jgi:Alpha-L-arabinofuranosidase B (ABFB) domain
MMRKLLSSIAVLSLGLSSVAWAQQDSSVSGGRGGRYFEYSCGPGTMLVGLHGSAGVLVDAVQAVCAGVDAAGVVSAGNPQGPVFGGPRPFDKVADCPPQQAIRNIAISESESDPLVGSIKITCQEVARPDEGGQTDLVLAGTGHLRGYEGPNFFMSSHDYGSWGFSQCTGKNYAVGIRGRSSNWLNAIGLICAPKPTAASVTTNVAAFANLVGQEASFQTSNFNDRFIRHRQSLGYAEAVSGDLGRDDSTFKIDPGLAGKCISLESHNYPGQFLRHQAWRVKLAPNDNSDLFKQDATFCMVPGLATSAGVSFESVNYPHHFIRHRNGELWIDDFDGSDLFRADATFNVTNPGGALMVR